MPRYPKQGLDYGPVPYAYDCELEHCPELRPIRTSFGWKGLIVYAKLVHWIHNRRGYYSGWEEPDVQEFVERFNVYPFITLQLTAEIVKACLKCGLFDQSVYERERVLTSETIQHTWRIATRKRTKCYVVAEYWITSGSKAEDIEQKAEDIEQIKSNRIIFISIREQEKKLNDLIRGAKAESAALGAAAPPVALTPPEDGQTQPNPSPAKLPISTIYESRKAIGSPFVETIARVSINHKHCSVGEIMSLLDSFYNMRVIASAPSDPPAMTTGEFDIYFINWLNGLKINKTKNVDTKQTPTNSRANTRSKPAQSTGFTESDI